MGVVYRAEDTTLKRTVALKFLPVHLSASEQDRARFLQEAQAAAALNHPNICTIYGVDEHDGQAFIVMEFVDGRTLKAYGRTLTIQDAIGVAIQIGEGLQAAHLKGVVHRDIKPENIMVTSDDRIKVMDFGLAKLKGSLNLTRTSSTVGTLAYMSPEQIQGKEVDTRADIFSFGVLFFELLTGHLPFRGEHDASVMYSILNEEAEPIQKYRDDASPELVHILNRALEKDPNDRYQSMGDLLIDLRRLKRQSSHDSDTAGPDRLKSSSGKSLRQKPRSKNIIAGVGLIIILIISLYFFSRNRPAQSAAVQTVISATSTQPVDVKYKLAILPFHNLGSDESVNFLGFALADNIITSLSYVRSITVRPSSSVAQYKIADPVPAEIAKNLDVNVILTGNYMREGDNLHLNAQLVDLGTNSIIWQKPLDVKYKSIISLQRDITTEIISGLKLSLTNGEQSKITGSVPQDAEAYEDFLRGRSLSGASDLQSLKRAIAFFDEAIGREPSFAPAYAEKGYTLIYMGIFSGDTTRYDEAQSTLQKALAIDSTSSDALSRLGFLYIQRAQKEKAFPLLQHAVEITPNVSDIHDNLSYFYRLCGLCDEADHEASLALRFNPGDRRAYIYKMYSFFSRGRNDEAIAVGREGLERVPFDSQIFILLASVYYFEGNRDSLEHYSELAGQADPQSLPPIVTHALSKALRGDRTGALALLHKVGENAKADMELSLWMSFPYAELGMKNETLYWIKAAMAEGLDGYPWFSIMNMYDKFRDDPEFKQVSDQMRAEYVRLSKIYGKGSS